MLHSVFSRFRPALPIRMALALALMLGAVSPISAALAAEPTPKPTLASASTNTPAPTKTPVPTKVVTPTAERSKSPTATPPPKATATRSSSSSSDSSDSGTRRVLIVVLPYGGPTATATATATPTPTPEPLDEVAAGLFETELSETLPESVPDDEESESLLRSTIGSTLTTPTNMQANLVAQVAEPVTHLHMSPALPHSLGLGMARVAPSLSLTGFWKVMSYRDLIQRSAELTGADPAIIAALMEVEGSGETSVSPAGAMGLMQLMPDKLGPGDDPFDPRVNVLRAAQHIRALQERWKMPELVAAAYFGALSAQGSVTGASDGNVTGFQYVELFRAAYQRYSEGLVKLPVWLVSPLGDINLSSDMIKFGFLGNYNQGLALAIRGQHGVERYGTSHLALDLQVPGHPDGGRGRPVVAPFDGRVIRTADAIGGPFGIWLESEKLNLRARLMHMDGLVKGIETGVQVKAGQQLGILGGQGTEDFPHLHLAFERLSDGERINPALFYRLRDHTDPATLLGRWYDDLPDVAPSVPPAHLHDPRTIADGDAHPSAEGLKPSVGLYVGGDLNEAVVERFTVEVPVVEGEAEAPVTEPSWQTLIEENFSTAPLAWPNNPDATAWFGNGAYRVFAREPGQFAAIAAPLAESHRDVVVSGTFRKAGGPPGGGYGLIVRDEGPGPRDGRNQAGRFYAFGVNDRGEIAVGRWETDHWLQLLPWTRSRAVRTGRAANELMVGALGGRLTFLVNGTEVASLADPPFSETVPTTRWGPFELPVP
jgi:hypothetical protein